MMFLPWHGLGPKLAAQRNELFQVLFFFRGFLFQPQTGTLCSWGGSAGTAWKPHQAVVALGCSAETQNPPDL